jgi:hypothetical protein
MSANKRFLVVVRAGDQSLHPQWTRALATRDWDLVVSYYGEDPERFRAAGETRIDDKGLKWQGLHGLLTRETFWRGYEYVWLPDDDLAADQATISEFFAHVAELGLSLAQPALTWDSHHSHLITLRHPSFRARWTDFIEIMAPCFEVAFLDACLPTFAETLSGWGLDWVWPRRLGENSRHSAIIDATAVTHTRPVGGPSYGKLAQLGINAEAEGLALMRRHGIAVGSHKKVLAAIDQRGARLDSADPATATLLDALLARDRSALLGYTTISAGRARSTMPR